MVIEAAFGDAGRQADVIHRKEGETFEEEKRLRRFE
jgi:hypothetical protein